MILVDSSVLIDYLNGTENWQTSYLEKIIGVYDVVIGDFIKMEVLQGIRNDKQYKIVKHTLEEFQCYELLGNNNAVRSAENYRLLRKKGITIRKSIDVIIATYCIENNLSLLHNDRDFDRISECLDLEIVSQN